MRLEKVIEEKLTEWRGKTIASNDQFMNELEHTLRATFEAGFDAGGQTVGGTGRIMYERGLAEGRAETNDEAYQQGVKDTKDSYQTGYLAGAQALLTELGKVEEKKLPKGKCMNLEKHLFGSCFQCEKSNGFNLCLQELQHRAGEFIKSLEKGE